MPKSERLDRLLLDRDLAATEAEAQGLIRAAKVKVNGHPETKPGTQVRLDATIEVAMKARFVSRGGEKLQGALDHWPIDLTNRICMDIGASTGGFTDCMLQAGASRVFAVDTGRGQIAYKLREDERVTLLENFNARHLKPEDLAGVEPSFASVDVSFISLTRILPALMDVMSKTSECMTLIKPQFEARREQVPSGGVVIDPEVHEEVCERIRTFAVNDCGLTCVGIVPSPLKGPAGNVEFLAYWTREAVATP